MSGSRQPLFGYRPGATVLHRTPVSLKFPALMLATILVFSLSWKFLLPLSAAALLCAYAGKLETRGRSGALKLLAMWVLFIGFFRMVGKPLQQETLLPELIETVLYGWRLGVVMLAGAVFYETTSGLEIRDSFSRAEEGLNRAAAALSRALPVLRKRPPLTVPRFAFVFSLTIIFIPRIFDAWEALETAWQARGGSSLKGFRGAYRKISTLLPLLVIRLLSVAADTDRAIRNRSR